MAEQKTLNHIGSLDQFQAIEDNQMAEINGGGCFGAVLIIGLPLVVSYGIGYAVGYYTNKK
ncbi:MAG: Class IIb bacteriocin, lactobin A/cerein 7B family [Lactococcus sp.]|jgi:hypothetical protein